MAIQMNVAEAKAKLSQILDAAEAGEEVTIARSGKVVARLVPVAEPKERTLGFLDVEVPDALFDGLDEAALAAWQ